ncbi:hypothetical protein [Ornithinimicrobium tianjinense]|uniref:Uncharacterized protein n=1 Tax=Ornithinimicrobium tianjinense TaxID=1195761 RepID=A0A917F0X1_9MICO|nr:hypothetical protein [Ornithinimicrobium tianjinense]GGF41285.1 hypothetical protein GCM10011366_06220 [Ornithinimicrobium tianjinense]
MTASAPTRAERTPLRSMLVGGLVPTLPLLVVVPLLAWAAAGEWAGVSAALGAVISLVVFVLGVVGIRGVLAGPTATTMAGAFAVFVVQMGVLAAVIWSLGQTTWLEVVPLVIAFVLVGLVFQAGLVVGYLRSRSTLDVQLPGSAA